jgi:hypothetical protein
MINVIPTRGSGGQSLSLDNPHFSEIEIIELHLHKFDDIRIKCLEEDQTRVKRR